MHGSFPTSDGGLIHADQYGKGDRGVVLAHGGRFNKESWLQQALLLAQAGFRVLAIDFRGEGQSRGGTQGRPTDEGRSDRSAGAARLGCVYAPHQDERPKALYPGP